MDAERPTKAFRMPTTVPRSLGKLRTLVTTEVVSNQVLELPVGF